MNIRNKQGDAKCGGSTNKNKKIAQNVHNIQLERFLQRIVIAESHRIKRVPPNIQIIFLVWVMGWVVAETVF